MNNLLNPYDLSKGARIRVTIPEQYKDDHMFIDGVETPLKTYTAARVIVGTFEGMPSATSGFYFRPEKPMDGGLHLLAPDTDIRLPVTARDMITNAR
jgi:hypothetical protein